MAVCDSDMGGLERFEAVILVGLSIGEAGDTDPVRGIWLCGGRDRSTESFSSAQKTQPF